MWPFDAVTTRKDITCFFFKGIFRSLMSFWILSKRKIDLGENTVYVWRKFPWGAFKSLGLQRLNMRIKKNNKSTSSSFMAQEQDSVIIINNWSVHMHINKSLK